MPTTSLGLLRDMFMGVIDREAVDQAVAAGCPVKVAMLR